MTPAADRPGYLRVIGRGWRLRCPRCGDGKLFQSWISMCARCERCGLDFRREPGFYLGSTYINYGMTALVLAIAFPTLVFTETLTPNYTLANLTAFIVIFPLWFFRYARSLWLAFDQYWDPDDDPRQFDAEQTKS